MREVYFIEQSRHLSQERKLRMLGRNPSEPALFQMVDVESLVPENHQLRKIDAVLDLDFVPEVVAECYSANRGRPSIDPELALRMMLLGVLYDLSDRELCDEIQMHAGMRWFCGLNFHDPVPDHSTLSRLRNERWSESGLFERLMDEVIRQCSEAGLVSGRHLSVDGTEVRADASVKSLTRRGPRGPGDQDPPQGSKQGTREPKPAGEWKGHGQRYTNETHFSPTDPDARLYRKGNQRGARLSYLVHDLIDTKSRVILRRKASLATGSAERDTALEMLDEVLESRGELGLPKQPEILTGDAGYGGTDLIAELLDRGIEPHVPLLAGEAAEEVPKWKRRTFDLQRKRARARKVREVEARNRVREIHQTRGYRVSRKLRIRSEHLFAEGKNEHGLRRARRRGRERVDEQATLCAVVQNLKRLVAFRGRTDREAAAASSGARSLTGFQPPMAHLRLFLTPIWTIVTHFTFRLPSLRPPHPAKPQTLATSPCS
jgi:transposase